MATTGGKRMNEITYCTRDCANYRCSRNKDHLDKTDFAYFGWFDRCEGYIEPNKQESEG